MTDVLEAFDASLRVRRTLLVVIKEPEASSSYCTLTGWMLMYGYTCNTSVAFYTLCMMRTVYSLNIISCTQRKAVLVDVVG